MMILSTSTEEKSEYQPYTESDRFVRSQGSYNISTIAEQMPANYSSNGRKLALISGAGIAGFAAAFELKAKGYDVIIAEKRSTFSRSNIINLNREAQFFLRKFELLEEFEASVAARIKEHQIVVFGKDKTHTLETTDVSQLQFEGSLNKDPLKFKKMFMESGIYSVQIKDLQAFLAQKAAKLGIQILGDVEVKIVNPLNSERVSKVEITKNNHLSSSLILEPDLFFIAEGTGRDSAKQLGMIDDLKDEVKNACTGENWIFGNLHYQGEKTFVVSMVTTTQKTLEIANVIFNAKVKIVNVAVTSDAALTGEEIDQKILATALKAFNYKKINEAPKIIETVKSPVLITNRIASLCSKGNVFRIGDAAGNSSPLAGLGGTLALTLVPCTVEHLLDDIENMSDKFHQNFKTYSHAYINKWIDKSQHIKKAIQGIFDNDQSNTFKLKDAHEKEVIK